MAASTEETTANGNGALRAPSATSVARSALLVIVILALGKAFSLSEKWIGLDRFGVGTDWDTFTAANQPLEFLGRFAA